jgi:hypothetical protein
MRGSNPVPGCFAVRGWSGDGPVSCDSHVPTVTARAHRGPAVSDTVRTQRGPGACATASLGSSLGPLGTGRSYSSAGTGTDRGCPWMTARNRWLGHVGGTAGEDGAGLRRDSDGHQLDRRARPVLGDHLPRWQVAGGDAAGLLQAPGRSEPDNHDEPSEAEESPEGEEHNADEAVLPGHDQHGQM